jgi:hypothetical protein
MVLSMNDFIIRALSYSAHQRFPSMELAMANEPFPLINSADPQIRASDVDRERMSDLLRRHHLAGRLDTSEFQERLERSLQARTLGELRALTVDLPGEDVGHERRGIPALRRTSAPRLAVAATVLTALIVASAFAQRPLFFPAVPFVFFWLRGFWWHGRVTP